MVIIRLDSNNNNSKWKMFFDKINNGLPFGVITFNKLVEPSSYFDEIIMNSYISSEPTNQDFLYMKTSQARHSI